MRVLVDSRLFGHPKLIALAKRIGRAPAEAAGYLACLWGWAAEYRLTGSLAALEPRAICSAAGWRGKAPRLFNALKDLRWLDGDGDSLQIHDWHEHQGKYIERILRERARKRRGDSAPDGAPDGAEPPRQKAPPVAVAVSVAGSVAGSNTTTTTPTHSNDESDPSTDYTRRVKHIIATNGKDPDLVKFLDPALPDDTDSEAWETVAEKIGPEKRAKMVWELKGRGKPWRTTWALIRHARGILDTSGNFPREIPVGDRAHV